MKIFYGLILSLLLAINTFAYAANIQDINVYTSLNQPLIADIPISNISVDSFEHLRISLADQNEFANANIPFTPMLNQLRFTKIVTAKGGYAIRVTTRKPINEPIINLLIKFKVENNYLTKQYTLLLDPPAQSSPINSASIANARRFEPSTNIVEQAIVKTQDKKDIKKDIPSTTPLLPTPAQLQQAEPALVPAAVEEQSPVLIKVHKLERTLGHWWMHVFPAWLYPSIHTADTTENVQLIGRPLEEAPIVSSTVKPSGKRIDPKSIVKEQTIAPVVIQPKNTHSLSSTMVWLLVFILAGLLIWRYRDKLIDQVKLYNLLEQHVPILAKLLKREGEQAVIPPKPERIVSSASTEPVQKSAVKMSATGDIDPLEEAEILYKYGRYEQAEGVLLMAVKQEANRAELYLKLLEVYGSMNRQDDFNQWSKKIPVDADSEIAIKAKVKQFEKKFFGPKPIPADKPNAKDASSVAAPDVSEPEQSPISHEKIAYINDKIRIVKACIEMQDYQNAQDILEELKNEGTPEQNEEVRQLFKKLPDKNVIDFKLGDE